MPPPTTQAGLEGFARSEEACESYMNYQESLGMNSGAFDNFAQEQPFETLNGSPAFGPQSGNPNFLGAVWGPPQTSWGPPVTASWV